ncbi:MAG: hypothetical protein ACJ8I3_14785, partial [Paraburkholderia graminis]
ERNLVIAIVAGHGIPLRSGLFPGPAKGALFNRLFNRFVQPRAADAANTIFTSFDAAGRRF